MISRGWGSIQEWGSNNVDTLSLFYKQRSDWETSQPLKNFDSRCLTVAYFWSKILDSRCLFS